MAPTPGQPVHSHMLRELSETGHAIVRSKTVTVFCRYHDNYSSGQNKVNVRLACNDRATVIPFSFRTRFVFVL